MADLEPIVGRYLGLTLGGRPHRVYFEEAFRKYLLPVLDEIRDLAR